MTLRHRYASAVFAALLWTTHAAAVPDDIAYTALFHVVRSAPPPHWDRPVCLTWLADHGILGPEADVIIDAATAYHVKLTAAEAELARVNKDNAGNKDAPDIERQRQAIWERLNEERLAAVSEIQGFLTRRTKASFSALINQIKINIKMKAGASVNWVYVTAVETPSLQISGTAIAGTSGAATRTVETVAVRISSPQNRTATAVDHPHGTIGQATAYLDLCSDGVCEDGSFSVTSTGTRETRETIGAALELPENTTTKVTPPWVKWETASANKNSLSRNHGTSTVTGQLKKSAGCWAVTTSVGLHPNPATIMATHAPNDTQPANFRGTPTAQVTWQISTPASNPSGGLLGVGLGIDQAVNCEIKGLPVTMVDITVRN